MWQYSRSKQDLEGSSNLLLRSSRIFCFIAKISIGIFEILSKIFWRFLKIWIFHFPAKIRKNERSFKISTRILKILKEFLKIWRSLEGSSKILWRSFRILIYPSYLKFMNSVLHFLNESLKKLHWQVCFTIFICNILQITPTLTPGSCPNTSLLHIILVTMWYWWNPEHGGNTTLLN